MKDESAVVKRKSEVQEIKSRQRRM